MTRDITKEIKMEKYIDGLRERETAKDKERQRETKGERRRQREKAGDGRRERGHKETEGEI